jgi:hypothetical protein
MLLHRVVLILFLRLIPLAVFAQHSPLASESGVYHSSNTPPTLPWNTYNYCNAPHVNAGHYELPPHITSMGGGKLVHVSVVMRHHKVSVAECVASRPPRPSSQMFTVEKKVTCLTDTAAASARRTILRPPNAISIHPRGGSAPKPALFSSRMTSAGQRSRMTRRHPSTTRSRP